MESKDINEQNALKGVKGPFHYLDTLLQGRTKADAAARARGVNLSAPDSKANANKDGKGSGMTDAQIKAAQDAANKARRSGQMSDIRGGGGNKVTPTGSSARPTTTAKPQLTAQQKKDNATNTKYQQLRKTDPAKAKEFGMKANQAKFGKDFAKPKTPNPLMKDMPGRNKAELERVRGNAAINSIAKSPSAKKILNTSKIGQASLNRSQFGSATKPKPASTAPKPIKPFKPLTEDHMDNFDLILEHLVSEGYTDTKEQALVVMTHMSEQWRDGILERYKGKHGQSSDEYKDDRSPGGKMVSGDSKQSGAEYTHGRRVKAANPGSQPDEGGKTKPKSQGKMDKGTKADLEYRKANLKKEEVELDENRAAARAAGGYKDDSKKQPDPSKEGFTGVGKMSIKDIMALNKKIEARNKKK